ncbi:DUF4136 domain-containing protein [Qipengyuania sp. DGS5-3]|uniref:DUF4136 domain-containing protein n=1 Tax=Qipengyuania sp. DGS5-3 TaxID=3349632 RepID=UPI0036D27359
MIRPAIIAIFAASLTACATAPGPVEVTRFIAPESASQLGTGTVFVTAATGIKRSLEDAPYRSAVAQELEALGYTEGSNTDAAQVAEVSVERYVMDNGQRRRGPVSVGVGGSTGSYGSGVGLGVGINLGGGGGPKVGTELTVVIRDAASGNTLWEGRADFAVSEKSDLAQGSANAQTVAKALFREFPGNNGETVSVKVSE